MISGFDMDRGAKAQLVNMYVNVKEVGMGGADCLPKLDRVATIEVLKEKKEIMTMGPQQEDVNKPEPRSEIGVY